MTFYQYLLIGVLYALYDLVCTRPEELDNEVLKHPFWGFLAVLIIVLIWPLSLLAIIWSSLNAGRGRH